MPKRSCPFPQNTNLMKMHIDMRHVGKEQYQQEVYGRQSVEFLAGNRNQYCGGADLGNCHGPTEALLLWKLIY